MFVENMSDPFAALAEAQVTEFAAAAATPAPAEATSPSNEAETVEAVSSEPAGEPAQVEEATPAETPEGVETAAPSEPVGESPAGEEPVSGPDDMAIALRAAGGDPNKIPFKLRETLDKYSKLNNEFERFKKEVEARKAETPAPPVTPAQPAAVAPVHTAPASVVQPDPQATEKQISEYLGQDADYIRAAQSHYQNLSERVKIVGGTNDQGQRVRGELHEVREKILALEQYDPEKMKAFGITLDEFATSQFNPAKIASDLAILRAKEARLEARDETLQLQNARFETVMTSRQKLISDSVRNQLTSAAREEEEAQSQSAESEQLAKTFNATLANLVKQHNITDEDEIVNISLRAQKAARQDPETAISDISKIINAEVTKALQRLDKAKRDTVRAAAIRKDAVTKPQAPAGAAAVASPKPSSTSADPFEALKQADKARYQPGA